MGPSRQYLLWGGEVQREAQEGQSSTTLTEQQALVNPPPVAAAHPSEVLVSYQLGEAQAFDFLPSVGETLGGGLLPNGVRLPYCAIVHVDVKGRHLDGGERSRPLCPLLMIRSAGRGSICLDQVASAAH